MVAGDIQHVEAIERFIGRKVERVKLEDYSYEYTALFEQGKPGREAPSGRIQGVRLSGGYYFGPARRRKR